MFYENNDIDITNHKNTTHIINIKKNTSLYKIIRKNQILVNPRHKSALNNNNYLINSTSLDKITESLEDSTLKFFLGLQWHPENLYAENEGARAIFDYFVKICHN